MIIVFSLWGLFKDTNNYKFYLSTLPFIFSIITWIFFDFISNRKKITVNTHFSKNNFEHIQERYVILFMVFVGEAFISNINSTVEVILEDHYRNIVEVIGLFSGTSLMLMLWFLWFTFLNTYPDGIESSGRSSVFAYSTLFTITSFILHSDGFEALILDPNGITTKWLLIIGALLWGTFTTTAFFGLKTYNSKFKIPIPRWVLFIGYFSLILGLLLIGTGFIKNINIFDIWLMLLSNTIIFVTSWIISYILISKREIRTNYKSFYIRKFVDHEFRLHYFYHILKPFVDEEYHKKYNYELNIYSKYILRKHKEHEPIKMKKRFIFSLEEGLAWLRIQDMKMRLKSIIKNIQIKNSE
ncbi:MAG: hypothetical protein K4H23_05360 [Mollicutes bacterium PWAP]|nr:hypothetical protein [Mollicutes bacterium PWAP]